MRDEGSHMSSRFRVALLIESSRSYGRQLLKGIAAYARTHGLWTFFHQERAFGDLVPPALKAWKPHGIIARLAGARVTRQTPSDGLAHRGYVSRGQAGGHSRGGVRSGVARAYGGRPFSGSRIPRLCLLRIYGRAVLRSARDVFRRAAFPTGVAGEHVFVPGDAPGFGPGSRGNACAAVRRQARGMAPRPAQAARADGVQRRAVPSKFSPPAARRALPCPTRWRSSAWITTTCSANFATHHCRASIRTSNRSVIRRRPC